MSVARTKRLKSTDRVISWRPIGEYAAEMGSVVVWLSWCSGGGRDGLWVRAHLFNLTDGAIWVDSSSTVPIETPGTRVTHFMQPGAPG